MVASLVSYLRIPACEAAHNLPSKPDVAGSNPAGGALDIGVVERNFRSAARFARPFRRLLPARVHAPASDRMRRVGLISVSSEPTPNERRVAMLPAGNGVAA